VQLCCEEDFAVTQEELDEVRRLLVAFEDAATWCQQIAELVRDFILRHAPGNTPESSSVLHQIQEMLRHLEADRRAVGMIRTRIGLPPTAA
jgi:hypothetical protein